MRDGLYRVCLPYLCAGFVVKNGEVVRCAPVLVRHLNSKWLNKLAHRVTRKSDPLTKRGEAIMGKKSALGKKWNDGKKKAGDMGEAVPLEVGRYTMQLLKAECTTIQDARKLILKWGVVSAPDEDDLGKVCTDFYTIDDEERIVWVQRTLISMGVSLDDYDVETEDDLVAIFDELIEAKACCQVQVTESGQYRNMRVKKRVEVDEDDLLDVGEVLKDSGGKSDKKSSGKKGGKKGKDDDDSDDDDDGDGDEDYSDMDLDELLGLCGEREIKLKKSEKSSKKKLIKKLEEWDEENGDDADDSDDDDSDDGDDGDDDDAGLEKGDTVKVKIKGKKVEATVAKVDGDDITVKYKGKKHEVAAGDCEKVPEDDDDADDGDDDDDDKGGDEPEFEVHDKVLAKGKKGKIVKIDTDKEKVQVKINKTGKKQWVAFSDVEYQTD